MGWFSKRPKTLVPSEVLSQLHVFGRVSWESKLSGRPTDDPRFNYENFFAKVFPACQSNLKQAIAEMHAATVDDPLARYGGYCVIAEFEPATKDPLYLEMMDAGLQMMYDRGLSSGHLNGYQRDRWVATHGDIRTSFDRIVEVASSEDIVASLDLPPGESLIVVKMGPETLDNEFWIERLDASTYRAFSMRQWNSDATTLTRCEEEAIGKFDSVDGILRSVGDYLKLPPYWAHAQLQPFFPERRNL